MIDPDEPLKFVPSIIADKTCGLFAAIACLAALRHKEKTGEGQYVAVPMLETFTGFIMAEHLYGETYIPPTGKFGHTTTLSPYRKPLRTRDGWIMVMPASQAQAAKFLELGGFPDAYGSERFLSAQGAQARVAVYNEMLAEATITRTTAEWLELCAAHSVPAMIANAARDVLDDPQLKVTLFEEREHETQGRYRAMKPRTALRQDPGDDPPRAAGRRPRHPRNPRRTRRRRSRSRPSAWSRPMSQTPQTQGDEVLYEVSDHIATITLNRPERMNTISRAMLGQLTEHLLAADADPDVRVVILTGTGRAFCAGLDLSEAVRPPEPGKEGISNSTTVATNLDLRNTPPTVLFRHGQADHLRAQRLRRRAMGWIPLSVATSASWRRGPRWPPPSPSGALCRNRAAPGSCRA